MKTALKSVSLVGRSIDEEDGEKYHYGIKGEARRGVL